MSPTVGMVGAGQLARMAHQASIPLGVELRVLADAAGDPAVGAGATHLVGSHESLDDLQTLAEASDVVTFDHEHVPTEHLRTLAKEHVVRPGPGISVLGQDKELARQAMADAGLPVPAFAVVAPGDVAAVDRFAAEHGWPVVAKAPRGGYDGKGVVVIDDPSDVEVVDLGSTTSWLLEAHVDIALELAVVLARRPGGEVAAYPVVETHQRDGICHELVMPARVDDAVAQRATELALAIVEGTDAAGILAVELFLTGGGDLVINEIAARPHNSGHATIEASVTSQFENHLRGVLDWPLGDTAMRAPAAAMVNLLGPDDGSDPADRLPRALEVPGAHVHLYGKQARPGRKLGHVTVVAADHATALAAAREAAAHLTGTAGSAAGPADVERGDDR